MLLDARPVCGFFSGFPFRFLAYSSVQSALPTLPLKSLVSNPYLFSRHSWTAGSKKLLTNASSSPQKAIVPTVHMIRSGSGTYYPSPT